MSIINVNLQDTFNTWRLKTNSIGDFIGDPLSLNVNAKATLVESSNELKRLLDPLTATIAVTSSTFKINVDSGDSEEFSLDAAGNLILTGNVTSARFYGPLTGNVTGNTAGVHTGAVIGNVTGNITGDLTGNTTGAHTGNVTGNVTGDLTGNVTGNATSASKFQTARSISITGDATWTTSLDGTQNVTGALTLSNSGVVAGTYTKITVDGKGRATVGTALTSSDVTTALGFTPLQSNGKAVDSSLLNGYLQATTATANTIMLRDGSGNVTVNTLYGTAQYANYADLAEVYSTDLEYAIGTVIVAAMGGDKDATQSWEVGQLAIGVISEKPAYLMNYEAEGQAVALKGRVPVRVIGPIKKGHSIVAGPDGRAIAGTINPIGSALHTNMDPGEKLVECAII